MESFFIFLPSIQKEFPRQVVESTLRGVWEVLQGKIMQDRSHTVCILQYDRVISCHARSCQQCMSMYVMYLFFKVRV